MGEAAAALGRAPAFDYRAPWRVGAGAGLLPFQIRSSSYVSRLRRGARRESIPNGHLLHSSPPHCWYRGEGGADEPKPENRYLAGGDCEIGGALLTDHARQAGKVS